MVKTKTKLKRLRIGIEGELATLNKKGYVVDGADILIKHLAKKKKDIVVEKECGRHMAELVSSPHEGISDTMANFFKHLEAVLLVAEKHDLVIFPLGSYPGKFNPSMREEKKYKIKESIFGKNRFKIAGRCFGFHCHFTLPKGTFDSKERLIKMLVRSTLKDSMMYSYNMLIAMDPALTTFTQSSPYYEGQFIGKDSRMIMYRGGEVLRNKTGLYANFEDFGELPPYKITTLDLLNIIQKRYKDWQMRIKELGINIKTISTYGSTLTTTWNPVKVNPNGTLEQRGMDMNHPAYILGAGTLIKQILRYIQEKEAMVIPSDIALKEPFKMEGNIIYITPHTYVRKYLQPLAAYEGLSNNDVLNYCKRLLRLAKTVMPKNRQTLIEPFEKMIKEKKTISDRILDDAKKKGYSRKAVLPNNVAAEIALKHSQQLYKEIVYTRKLLSKLN